MSIEQLRDGIKMIEGGVAKLHTGGVDYTLKVLVSAHNLLMTRFAPYKVNDRVKLAMTPVITRDIAWGWMAGKHFLVKGATGVVKEAKCSSDGRLMFSVQFDNETYLDNGIAKPVSQKHTFSFGEEDLEKIETANGAYPDKEVRVRAEFIIRPYRIGESSISGGGDPCMEISEGAFPGVVGRFIRATKLTIGDKLKVTIEKI